MRVAIVGAGAVGTSIARELCARRHEVCVIEPRHEIAERADLGSAAVLVGVSLDLAGKGMGTYFMSIDKCRFRQKVVPGDVLEMHVEIKRVIRNMAVYDCVAKVDGEIVACAEVLCAGTRE